MADKKKMSVADILAAARKADRKGGESTEAAASEGEAEPVAAAAEQPPTEPKATAPAKPAPAAGGKPSTADILAMARGAKKGPAVEKPALAPKPAAKPAARVGPKAAAAATTGGAKDTASILAAARKPHKPGPMTKAEAAATSKPAPAAPAAKRVAAPPMPTKPAYAKPKPAKPAEEESRRGFFSLILGSFLGVGFTMLALTNVLWALGTARFMYPNVLTEPPTRFKVGFPSDYAPGYVETKYKAQFGVWVACAEYEGQLEIYALRTVCTHLGCTPNWLEAEQKFKCPCHGSGFYKDGINFEGPAPRPLERYAIAISDDGQLEVDKSKLFQEELGQWKDPACFIPV